MLVNTLTNVNKWHIIVKCYRLLFQINVIHFNFLFTKETIQINASWFPQKYLATQVFSTLITKIRVFWAVNQHIRISSEGSCETVDWSNDAENSALHYRNKLLYKNIKIENIYLKFVIILHNISFTLFLIKYMRSLWPFARLLSKTSHWPQHLFIMVVYKKKGLFKPIFKQEVILRLSSKNHE